MSSTTLINRSTHLIRRKSPAIEKRAERPFFSSFHPQGGVSTPPGSSSTTTVAPPPTTVATSYGYISDMFKSFVAKVENPLKSLGVPPKVGEMTAVESKTQIIQKSNENRVSRSEVTAKTRALVKKLMLAESSTSKLSRVRELSEHLMEYPPTRIIAASEQRLVADLLEIVIREAKGEQLRHEARQCLTLIGVQPPPKGRGVNVLSIDGGGTRGMMGLEVLEKIETLSGRKICELFDMVCGVSTGAIIAALLTVKGYTVKECREVYMDVSKRLFSQGKFQGGMGLILKHSYYNTNLWISILKEMIGEDITMINTSQKPHTPRLAIISSIVNLPTIQPYVFRNYEHPAGRDSHYRGGTSHPLWTAIQASAAAPLYFSEVQLEHLLLQDGGVYANNPTAIAYHETRLVWPHEEVNCVVSVGNGRTVTTPEPTPTIFATSIQDKLLRIIDSATDTEGVHMNVHDMLPEKVYYRFNPYMTYAYGLDEIDQERLEQMASDAEFYVRRNANKLEDAAARLCLKPNAKQRVERCMKQYFDLKGFYKPA